MLEKLDLNLLVYIDVLLEEMHITRASKRLRISQAALSNALARARLLLSDELLVRNGSRMVATTYAKQIKKPLRQVMESLSTEVLFKKSFDPNLDSFQFLTAFRGYEEAVLLPGLLAELSKYPKLALLNQSPKTLHLMDALSEGTVHLTLTPNPGTHVGILRKKVLSDNFVCVANKQFSKKTLTLQEYVKQRHLVVSLHGTGLGFVDRALERIEQTRFVAVRVGEFGTAPLLISKDKTLLTTIPERIAKIWVEYYDFKIFPCPFEIEPLELFLSWHSSKNKSPEIMWFKNLVESELKKEGN